MELTWETLRLNGSISRIRLQLHSREADSLFATAKAPGRPAGGGFEVDLFAMLPVPEVLLPDLTHFAMVPDPDYGIAVAVQPENIIGADNRVRVKEASVWPFSATGLIQLHFPNGLGTGTAFLIGPGLALTAAHCVYLPKYGGWVKSVRFAPAFAGTSTPFGHADAARIWVPKQWKDSLDSEFDIAVIQLSRDLTPACGYYGLGAFSDTHLAQLSVAITGYPADRDGGRFQYGAREALARIAHRRIYYTIDTFRSQSGSAVLAEGGLPSGSHTVVAVHTFGTPLENSGTRLTVPLIRDIAEIALHT